MSKVERFFHLRPDMNNGGACVRVTGDTEMVGQVDVQVAFCHTHSRHEKRMGRPGGGDPYSRKLGRTYASVAKVKVVPLRYLPAELGRIAEEAARRSNTPFLGADYSFAVKYFLPKE
jgi:hypothetical protein